MPAGRGSSRQAGAAHAISLATRFCLLLALLPISCASADPEPHVDGGYLFGSEGPPQFDFIAVTFDSLAVSQVEAQLALPLSQRNMHINGPIDRGDGGHNLDWKWHYLPSKWAMVELSIEVCDGTPDSLDADLNYWVDTIGQFCPWGVRVLERLYD